MIFCLHLNINNQNNLLSVKVLGEIPTNVFFVVRKTHKPAMNFYLAQEPSLKPKKLNGVNCIFLSEKPFSSNDVRNTPSPIHSFLIYI